MKFKVEQSSDDIIYNSILHVHSLIVKKTDEETLKAIEKYCEENDIIPNLIDKDKLDLVLKLGIRELYKLEMENKNVKNQG